MLEPQWIEVNQLIQQQILLFTQYITILLGGGYWESRRLG